MSDLAFTTIEEPARAALKISRDEYAICNYVQTWSTCPGNKRPGYCDRTKGQMAVFIGMSTRGIMKMLDKMERLELIERYSKTLFLHRITKRWFDTVTVAKGERKGEQSSSLPAKQKENKVPLKGEQSSSLGENKVPPHKEYNKELVRRGERTPTPAPEIQNLQSKKNESGLVAPAAENPETVKAEKKESPKVALKGSLTPPPKPYGPLEWNEPIECDQNGFFEVTAIASPTDLPGVMLVEAAPKIQPPTRVSTTIEAEAKIATWITGEGLETVKNRFSIAKQRFDPDNAAAIAAHYCSVYTKTPANKSRLLADPITHFSDGLFSYLKNEEAFGRSNAPRENSPTRNGNQQSQKSTLNRFGSDPAKYQEKPLF